MPAPYRVVGDLTNSDLVMNNGLWIGVYPGLTEEMRAYVAEEIIRAVRGTAARLPIAQGG